MAKTGFEVQDRLEGRAGEVDTSTASAAGQGKVSLGPEIGMKQSEGEQIGAALSRFAPAGSKLIENVYGEVRRQKEHEGAIDAATRKAMANPDDQHYVNGYNAMAATQRMSEMTLALDEWSKKNPAATAEELAKVKTELYEKHRPEFAQYGRTSLEQYDNVFIKHQGAVDAAHTKRREGFLKDTAVRTMGEALLSQTRELSIMDKGSEEYTVRRQQLAEYLETIAANPVANVYEAKDRHKAIEQAMVVLAQSGDDTLLQMVKDSPTLKDSLDIADGVIKANAAFTRIQESKTSVEQAQSIYDIEKGVEDGKVSLADYFKFYETDQFRHFTHSVEKFRSLEEKGLKTRVKAERDELLMRAAISGTLDDYAPSSEERNAAITNAYQWHLGNQGAEGAAQWAARTGYSPQQMQKEFESLFRIPVGEGAALTDRQQKAFDAFKATAKTLGSNANLTNLYGEFAGGTLHDMMVLEKTGIPAGLALRQIQTNKADPEYTKGAIYAFAKGLKDEAKGGWFGKDITNEKDIASMSQIGIAALKAGIVTTPEGAAKYARDRFLSTHTQVNGHYVPGTEGELQARMAGGKQVKVDTGIAIRTFALDPKNAEALHIKGIDPSKLRFDSEPGSNVVRVYDTSNPLAAVYKGSTTWDAVGRIHVGHQLTAEADRWRAVAANQQRAQEKDLQRADSAIGALLSGTEAIHQVGVARGVQLNGLDPKEIGYSLREWRALPREAKVQEIARLYSYAEAKHLGRDTKPFANPMLPEVKGGVTVDKMVNALIEAETPGYKGDAKWRRTDVRGPKLSAYGPGQMTFGLAQTAASDPAYGLTEAEKKWVNERYVPQGKMFHLHGENVSTPQYGPGGPGTLQPDERPIYMSVMKKVVAHYLTKYNGDWQEVARAWNQGPGSKTRPNVGYLKLIASNL